MAFGAETTTDEVLEGVRLDGKHAFVTGSTGGLGLETARALASHGASVTIAGRNPEKIEAALATLAEQVPGATVDAVQVDLASLASIADAAKTFVGSGRSIDLLINNAGVMMCPEGRTADGFETQIGTNHLGHFALTAQLFPAIAPGARIVNLSSGAHLRGTCNLDDLNWEARAYDPNEAYAHAKTANIWFTVELQRRYADRLLALAVHPGVIMTELGRHLTPELIEGMRASFEERAITFKSIPQGAATSVWAATAPELADHGGQYLADCGVAIADPEAANGYAPWAYDEEGAKQLWTKSEALTGVRFG